ncbi:MAG: hypothetical protein PHO01_05415 [Desulfotomaculaceae bacterium]|nr:hypothetical protein [Desulfotomaculaceae bacterium]
MMDNVKTQDACGTGFGSGNSAFIIFLILILLVCGLGCFGGCI